MNNEYDIRPVLLDYPRHRRALGEMLERNGLKADQLDTYYGVYDADDNLVGGAGAKGNVIKCVALDPQCREAAITNTLITRLRADLVQAGHDNIFVFTKPENERLFNSLAFKTVGRAAKAIMLESDPRGIEKYKEHLRQLALPAGDTGVTAVIVMNANPMTLGHYSLIKKAAEEARRVVVIPLDEDNQAFSYAERRQMLADGTAKFHNVAIAEGSPYQISAATFPSYFIKEPGEAAETGMELDLDIFCRHIAPALGATVRYAGMEPHDRLTAAYNRKMKELLPQAGIDFREVRRSEFYNLPISASTVRRHLAEGDFPAAQPLLNTASQRYALAFMAGQALRRELDLTPKPGLVDRNGCGSHTDMDYPLMVRSIAAVRQGLPDFIKLSPRDINRPPSQELGIAAERLMFQATGGVNTHKGALFSMGMTLYAAMSLLTTFRTLTPENLRQETALAASMYRGPENENPVAARYNVKSAYSTACQGYRQLYESWLPYYRAHRAEPEVETKTLLRIMAELDDINILRRGGRDAAQWLKDRACDLFNDYSAQGMQRFCDECKERNLSPGGAADMLALTFLIDSITTK